MMERSESPIGVDLILCLERETRPLLSKPCTAMAKALGLTDEDNARRMWLTRPDRVLEHQKPMPRRVRPQVTCL